MGNGAEQFVLPIEAIVQLMEDTFAHGGGYQLTVTGTSMSPTLLPGRDRVRLISVKQRPFRKNDIVFARRQNGGYVMHRVIRIHSDGSCTLNGDGQVWTEEIYPGDVLGVADAVCRKGTWISCDHPMYKLYVLCWAATRPFREILVKWKKALTGGGKRR